MSPEESARSQYGNSASAGRCFTVYQWFMIKLHDYKSSSGTVAGVATVARAPSSRWMKRMKRAPEVASVSAAGVAPGLLSREGVGRGA